MSTIQGLKPVIRSVPEVRDDADAIYEEREQIVAAKNRAVTAMLMAIRRTWTGVGARPDFDRFIGQQMDRQPF